MTERLVISNTSGLNREENPCLLKQSLEKSWKTALNQSGWAKYGVYYLDLASVWRVCKVYIKESSAAFTAAEPLIFHTKLSAPLIELNKNAVDALTTDLATEIYRKLRRVEAASAAK